MSELVFKIMLAALVVPMNFIRSHYKSRYKKYHKQEREIASVREKTLVTFVFITMGVMGMIWLFTPWLSFGQYALPDWVRMLGFAVGVFGMWWFYRIHKALGDNWSPVLEVRHEHTLIVSGPYRWVRHPMYSDMLLWMVSFSLISANWFYAISLCVGMATLFSVRIPDEERMMTERFGEQYKTYMSRTKRLIPFVY